MFRPRGSWLTLAPCIVAAACATKTPDLVLNDDGRSVGMLVTGILRNVRCELQTGYFNALLEDLRGSAAAPAQARLGWLREYGAYITLSLQVREELAIDAFGSPTLDLGGAQTLLLGISAAKRNTAMRRASAKFYVPFSEFSAPSPGSAPLDIACCIEPPNNPDGNVDPVWLRGYLKLDRIFDDMVFVTRTMPMSRPEDISSQVQFTIELSADTTPVLQISRIVFGDDPLFYVARERTNDVTVTLGKVREGGKDDPTAKLDLKHAHDTEVLRSVLSDLDR